MVQRRTGRPSRSPVFGWPGPLARSGAAGLQREYELLCELRAENVEKLEALRVHRTQRASVERNFLAHADMDRLLSAEVFRLGWGPIQHRPLGDLFDGI